MTRIVIVLIVLAAVLAPPGTAPAQEEVSSGAYKYRSTEMGKSSYELYEVLPGRNGPALQRDATAPDSMYGPDASVRIMNRRMLADSHWNLPFYEFRRCTDSGCHPGKERNLHSIRSNITCRQCHGGEPIASIDHYRSPMNLLRRHAYVCAKCHQGANASFATYVIHEPDPTLASTASVFPALSWAFWIMMGIAVLTFALFLPHTVLWGLRELFGGRPPKGGGHG